MLAVIFSFLKSHWQTTLIVSAALSIMATISFQHLEIRHLKNELSECHAEGITLENSNRALLASVQNQNAAIAALQAAEQGRHARAASALKAAQARAANRALAAQRIKSLDVSGDECATLRKLVNDYVETVQKVKR